MKMKVLYMLAEFPDFEKHARKASREAQIAWWMIETC